MKCFVLKSCLNKRNLKETLIKIWFILILCQFKNVYSACLQQSCNANSSFRSMDGRCNNILNPPFGMMGTQHVRLKPARYSDGISSPPLSITGNQLPNPRILSSTLYRENNHTDSRYSWLVMIWGQFITHDIVLTPTKTGTLCCTGSGQFTSIFSTDCLSIDIPPNDPVYANRECMQFFRSTRIEDECSTSIPTQANAVTSFFDLSQLYFSSVTDNILLRDFLGGRLTTSNIQNFELPPLTSGGCIIDPTNNMCFLVGDPRGNQNPGLITLHTLFVRHHNYLADQISALHDNWGDEQRFQAARRINIAQYQQIIFKEYLPLLIGESAANSIFNAPYDETVNPSIIQEFTAAAFRFLHTQINGRLDFYNAKRRFERSLMLSDTFFKPAFLATSSNMEKLLRGMSIQEMEANDIEFNAEISRFMFKFNNELGLDLRAIDIQRGRDHGLASYNDMREYCGLLRATIFEDFVEINKETIQLMKTVYEHPDDVDLMVGGALETLVPGAMFGPTFNCIVTKQFNNLKVGDRFFYTSTDPNVQFTPEQFNEIASKSSMAAFICRASHVGKVQKFPFLVQIDPITNPLMNCTDFPEIDFSYWA